MSPAFTLARALGSLFLHSPFPIPHPHTLTPEPHSANPDLEIIISHEPGEQTCALTDCQDATQ